MHKSIGMSLTLFYCHTLGSVKNMFSVGVLEPELRIAIEKLIAKYCTRILAETERERMQLIQLYAAEPDKISVVPCGVNHTIFRPFNCFNERRPL